eukprot:661763-Pelagomonas_calceolata.AAC.3
MPDAKIVNWPNWLFFRSLEGTNGWEPLLEEYQEGDGCFDNKEPLIWNVPKPFSSRRFRLRLMGVAGDTFQEGFKFMCSRGIVALPFVASAKHAFTNQFVLSSQLAYGGNGSKLITHKKSCLQGSSSSLLGSKEHKQRLEIIIAEELQGEPCALRCWGCKNIISPVNPSPAI